MRNQNVQTNRHESQNKGCNQAFADSKHYLVSKIRPPCPYEVRAKSSVANRLPKFYPRYNLKCFTALEWCVK